MSRVSPRAAARARTVVRTSMEDCWAVRSRRPPHGWVRTVRTALGISAGALAARLDVTPGAVIRLEQSEADNRIRLETLHRAADALDCDLVYLVVPRSPADWMD